MSLFDVAERAAELRRRNLIKAEQIPYKTAFGNTYDSGNFPDAFERALAMADHAGFKERRKAAKKAGKLRGIGIGCYLEIAGAFPEEGAAISFPGGKALTVSIGASSSGQGHRTVFGGVAAKRLGVPFESVSVTSGDSARDVPGFGAVASRSAMYVGGAVANTCDAVIAKGRKAAAILLQAPEDKVEYRGGNFVIAGSGRSMSLFDVAERAAELVKQGVIPESLDTKGGVKAPPSFPNGCHVAEVEIDPDTGVIEVMSYKSVNDFGTIINPLLVAGQVHGGVVQGIGQALMEHTAYDEQGQLLTGSFMDYAMPRASDMPEIEFVSHPVPAGTNPLGVKGCGEAGCAGALTSVMNAIVDALSELGVANIEMPATPQRVWQTIQDAKARHTL
jgi:carbon-monoxide dehydrogenase large subunit